MPDFYKLRFVLIAALVLLAPRVWAGPWLEVGRIDLRNDIQILADAGVITGPVSTWPLSWGAIAEDIGKSKVTLSDYEAAALARIRSEARRAMRVDSVEAQLRVAVSEKPVQIRSFDDSTREDAEIAISTSWTGYRFAGKLQGSWVDNGQDNRDWRLDGSYAGVALGNWTVSASMQDRWWGPGWQGSMSLSNNARPIPAITLDRNSTEAFKTKWLSWIGPWDFVFMAGQLESGRAIPDARFLGARLSAKPLKGLELGLNRTAVWCGQGRPCDLRAFVDLTLGRDNAGQNVSEEREPGNQLAGFDIRWSSKVFSVPYALYTHWSGEDQESYHPSKYAGQFGVETWGGIGNDSRYRLFAEVVDTECNFSDSFNGNPKSNCTYNSGLYQTGYRYRGRSIAHSVDNDSRILTLGSILNQSNDNSWFARIGYGELNRSGGFDVRNTVAQVRTEYWEASLSHRRYTRFGDFHIGIGYEHRENKVTGITDDDPHIWLDWVWQVDL